MIIQILKYCLYLQNVIFLLKQSKKPIYKYGIKTA